MKNRYAFLQSTDNYCSTSNHSFKEISRPKLSFKALAKQLVLFVFLLFSVIGNGWGQVSVTATAGTVGPTNYATVNAAFTAINSGTHQGAITLTITANTTEPATAVPLLKSAAPASYTSVLIKPSGNRIINSAAAPTASKGVIILNGADNVTIDGDDPATTGAQNLSIIVATNATTGTAAIQLASNSTTGADGANNNTVKNCIITGGRNSATTTTVSYGIVMCNITAITTGAYSSINTVIQNNIITRCWHGIYANGTSATYPNTGIQILNNTLGSATSANNIGFRGIYISYSAVTGTGALIEGNDIRVGDYGTTGHGNTIAGIEVNTVNYGVRILRNNIHDVSQPSTSGWGAIGIYVNGSTNNTLGYIQNNFIRDMTASNYSTLVGSLYEPNGIFFNAGATNYNVDFNTIVLKTPNSTGTVANSTSACLNVSATLATLSSLRNNIFVNSNSSSGAYGIYTIATLNISGGVVNNNNYYVPSGNIGYYNAANRTTLSAWQTATGKDANAINVNPPFVSSTDLHINTSGTGASSLYGSGATGTGITVDIDNDTRATTPCIGADEFIISGCTGSPSASTISGATTFCAGQTTSLSLSTSYALAGITYQWKSSTTTGGPYTNLGTGATQSTGALATTTYYICVITCSNSGLSVTTPEVVVTVNPLPTVSISSVTNTYCAPAAVAMTASGASTYSWLPTTGLNVSNVASVNASPTTTTLYTVTGTSASGCTSTATKTITKGNAVTMGTVTAAQPSACAGGTVQLNGSATVPTTVNAYSFAASAGQSLDPMVGATTLLASAIDNTASALTTFPAGFTFPYEGVNQTQFTVSDNGVFRFGSAAVSTTQYGSVNGSSLLLSPWAADMGTGSNGGVSYVVTGSAPNRIFVIQYKTTHTWSTSVAINNTYQIWLYETTGVIQYRYGALGSTGTVAHGIGLSGANTANYQSVNASTGLSSTSTVTTNATVPVSGTMYTFTPTSLSYAWTFTNNANSLSSTTITNPVATVNATDTYTLTATGNDGCSASASAPITLGGGTPTVTANATSTNLCVGASSTLSASITGGCSPFTYSWSNGTSVVSTSASFSATPASTTTYTLTLTDNNGTVVTSPVTITVNSLPTISVNSGTYCSGSTALALTASGASTYSWSPSTSLSASSGSTVNASPAVTTTYTVTGTDINGCISSAQSTVSFVSTPSAISIAQTPASVCSGGVATLTATGAQISASGYMAPASPTAQGGLYSATSSTTYYQIFDVLQATTLISVDVFPTAAVGTIGTISISNSTGTILTSSNYTVTNSNGTTAHTVYLNYPLSVGTGYRIGQTGTPITLNRNYTNQTYPVSNAFISVTGNSFMDPNYWYYVYNWNYLNSVPNAIIWSPTTDLYTNAAATAPYTGGNASIVYALNATPTTYTATSTNGVCSSSASITTVINPLPTITLGTASAVCSGVTSSSLSFAATTGSPNQYIIDYDATANAQGFVDISTYTNFTSSPITLSIPATAVAGTYNGTITVKNSSTGCISSAYSFTVTVNGAVVITTQPNNAVTLDGGDATFTVAANGTGLTYQWQVNTGSGFINISGATSATYTEFGVTASMSGYQYQCIVSGAYPCASVTSSVATLTISTTAITAQPVSTTICSNGAATFTISTSGSTPTYQWQVSTNSGSTWTDLTGENSSTLTVSGVTSVNSLQQYRCVLSGSIYSDAAIMTVYDAVVITTQPSDLTVCANAANASFTVGASGSGLTYQWQVSTNAGVSWSNATGASTASTYTISTITNALNQNQYRVIVSGASPCSSVTSNAVTLSVTGVTVASSVTSICQGSSFVLTATQTTGSPALSYSWLCSTAGSGATSALTSNPVTITPTSSGSYTYTLTSSGGGCTFTNTIAVISNANPTITTATASPSSVCSGSNVSLSATSLSTTSGTAPISSGASTATTYDNPFYSLWSHTQEQILVRASELTAAGFSAGNLTSLALEVVSGTTNMPDFTLSLQQTSLTALSTLTTTGWTNVYSNVAGLTPVVGVNTINFTTPFNWDGSSNILIKFCWGNSGTTATQNNTVKADATSYVSGVNAHNTVATSGSSICSSSTVYLTYSNRPKLIFGGQVATNVANSLNWSWNTTPVINAATGTTIATNNGSSSISQTYTVTATNPTTGCSSTSVTAPISINPVPSAPFATNSASCGPNIPTGSIASTSGISNPNLNWYTAATGGNLVLSSYTGALTSYYSNDFSSNTGIGVMTGNASLTGGVVQLTPNALSQLGALTIPASGVSADKYNVSFNLITSNVAQSGADGLSYSFGDDVSGTSTAVAAETGSGTKLMVSFDNYGTVTNVSGIRVIYGYNPSVTDPGTTVGTNGVLAYSPSTTWSSVNGNVPVIIDINNLGQLTLTVNGTAVFSNLQLPAAYLNADKSTWKHGFKARTGGVSMIHSVDNVNIQQSSYLQANTYPSVVPTTTTYYVNESSAGCTSSATPITFTVNTPPAMTLSSSTASVCAGSSSSLVTLTSNAADYTTYTWSPSATASGTSAAGWNFTPTAATTYTLTGTNASTGCANTATVAVSVLSVPSAVTVTPSAATMCVGNIQNLVATGGTMPNQTVLNENFNSGVGSFSVASTSSSANQNWAAQANGYVYSTNTFSGSTGGFMMANSDIGGSGATTNTILTSPSFSTVGFSGMTLSLKEYLNNLTDTYASIEISNDNFVSNITTLRNNISTDIGSAAVFNATSLTIPVAYENLASVKIRFRYVGSYDWYWAVDEILISGTGSTNITWTGANAFSNSTATTAYVSGTNASSIYSKPTATTTYTATATNAAGCTSSGTATLTLPTAGTALSQNNESATCAVSENGWIHFYHSSGRLIGSINSQGQNLGAVTVTSYVDPTNALVPACTNPNPIYSTSVMQRHWVITPTNQPSSAVLVRFPYSDAEFASLQLEAFNNANTTDDVPMMSSLGMTKYSNTNAALVNNTTTDNCGSGTSIYHNQTGTGLATTYSSVNANYVDFSIAGFSEFWLHGSSSSSPLPVELVNFQANCAGEGKVEVTWATASEHNSATFTVEKSRDGINWTIVSTVAGAGNSNQMINYSLVDNNAASGVNYYRLTQTDFDGASETFNIASANCGDNTPLTTVKVYPNPSAGDFYIDFTSEEIVGAATISITDARGVVVYNMNVTIEKGNNVFHIENMEAAPGMYYIQVSNGTNTSNIVKHSLR